MMHPRDLDTIRAALTDPDLPTDEAAPLARELFAELERTRTRESLLRVEHANLVAAARATLAAVADGDEEPTLHLHHELDTHGQSPAPGQHPNQILADAAALRPLLIGDYPAAA